jgi:hypothetical protein
MKTTFKNSILLIFIGLIFAFSSQAQTVRGRSRNNARISRNSPGLGDNGNASNGLRAGGTENVTDGGNPNKIVDNAPSPVGNGLPLLLLGAAGYGVCIFLRKKREEKG